MRPDQTHDQVYALIAELLRVRATFSDEIMRETFAFLREEESAQAEVLRKVLSGLIELSRRPKAPTPREVEDPIVVEVRAMLGDQSFVKTKGDLDALAGKQLVLGPPNSRQSLARAIDRFIAAFQMLPQKRRKALYSTLRRRYLRGRSSSLVDWSDIVDRDSSAR